MIKNVFILVSILSLSACYYPAPRAVIDPVTKAPTGETRNDTLTGDPLLGATLAGAAIVNEQALQKKNPKKLAPLPKPPEEVLKPMREDAP